MNPEIVGRIMDKAQSADREALFAALQAAIACLVDAEFGRPRSNPLEHVEERLDYGHPYGHEHVGGLIQGDETVTLWRTLTGALVQSVGVEPVGQFRRVSWCKTHDASTEDGMCLKREVLLEQIIDRDIAPCVLTEVWLQSIVGDETKEQT